MGGDICDFSGGFVVVVVEMELSDLELEVGDVVRMVWYCANGELYFLWRLSRKSLEGNMSKVGGHAFGMVMQASSLVDVFFFYGDCLGRVPDPRKVVVVVEMVVGMVWREVFTNSGLLMEVVILVLLMGRGWMWEMVVGVTEGVL